MAKLNQRERVLRHLRDYGSITQKEAWDYGIGHLASRIDELRKAGHPIQTRPETSLNRYGEKTTYARYVLAWKEEGAHAGTSQAAE